MLKGSKKGIHKAMNEQFKEYINQWLTILDATIQTQYQKIFYYVYIKPEKMKLEQIADQCFISLHKLLNDIMVVNRLITNTEIYYQNRLLLAL